MRIKKVTDIILSELTEDDVTVLNAGEGEFLPADLRESYKLNIKYSKENIEQLTESFVKGMEKLCNRIVTQTCLDFSKEAHEFKEYLENAKKEIL